MTMTTRTTKLILLSGVASLALLGQANALEAQAFVDRLAAVYQNIGYGFEFGEATLDGDTVTVDGVTVNLMGVESEPTSFSSPTQITFSGVVENEDGSYTAESVTIPDIDAPIEAEPAGRVTLADIRVDGLYLPAGDPVPATGLLQLFQAFSTGPLSVERDGEEVMSYDSVTSSSTFLPEFGTTELESTSATLQITGLSADLSTVSEEDPSAGAVIEQLGLTSINGDISMAMDWSMADGHMDVTEFLLDFADVGAINIKMDVTGFTPALLDQIYAMQRQMSAGAEMTEEEQQAQAMQSMALMQGVNIVGASVRYDDASIAPKLLDFFATSNGTERAQFVEGLKQTVPAMLAQSGIPALNDLVVPAVNAFLDDPQSLEVSVAPPAPTSLLVLMAAAANPAGLIDALGLSVEANTAAAE